MSSFANRRDFLRTAAAGGALAGMGDMSFLAGLPPVSAAEAKPQPEMVQFKPEIEPLVRLLEETPRGKLLEKVAERIRRGTSYREVLTALLLAGVRNVQPRPSVGYKFHAVLVVNSAHLAAISSPDRERWLPIFWALDYFKDSQADDVREGDWTMGPVDESAVPPPHKAKEAFIDAMDRWDVEAADAAVAGLARGTGAVDVFELFSRYGARDFRSIGHKAIFVSNSWRTLQCIGWRHAEPVLRSLAYALLNHSGEPNPAESDLAPDRPGRENRELAARIRDNWQSGKRDAGATEEMLQALHGASWQDACATAVDILNRGVSPQSIFDGLLVGSGELLMRQPGIVALHAVTSTNAFRYAFETTADDATRRMILLQNTAFLPLFRNAMQGRGKVKDSTVNDLKPAKLQGSGEEALQEIFDDVSGNPTEAARKVLAYLKDNPQAKELIDEARRLIFLKGNNAHDYKFSSAVLEDYYHTSPEWRDLVLATSVFKLRGAGDRDNSLVNRTREALS